LSGVVEIFFSSQLAKSPERKSQGTLAGIHTITEKVILIKIDGIYCAFN
jgi:hypothetical protein